MKILLDTHIWIWWVMGTKSLGVAARAQLDQLASRRALALSAMSLWEAQMLYSRGRLEFPPAFADWVAVTTRSEIVTVLPVDRDVVLAIDDLPQSFHGDPADRCIVATARLHALELATHDARIRRSRAVAVWRQR